MTRLMLMMIALGVIILVRFISDQSSINKLARDNGIPKLTARGLFRAEIYNAMAANKFISILFLAAVGYGVWLFFNAIGPDRILMPILTIILAMEIGRYMTRKDADINIAKRIAQRTSATESTDA